MRVRALLSVAALLVAYSTCLGAAIIKANDEDRYSIPKDLLIGAGVSAIQTEGAAFEDGKAESAADHVIKALQGKVFPVNPFTAADSYHRYQEDVDMAASLKLKLYKFSMSWSRVLPDADANNYNKKGVKFYHNLIDSIKAKGMTPLVMLYHFDHPQFLQKQFNGWQSSGMITKWVEYVEFVHKEYGSKVEYWATINEPNMYCSYFNSMFALADPDSHKNDNVYDCYYNSIIGHKKAYLAIKKNTQYKSKVGTTALFMPAMPITTRPEDVYAAEAYNQMTAGALLHPVVYGDFPQLVKNLAGSKLPQFTPEDKLDLANTTDFIGLNLYFGVMASYNRFHNSSAGSGIFANPVMKDLNFVDTTQTSTAATVFTAIHPEAMRNGLLWMHQAYNKPLIICENGFGDTLGLGMKDMERAAYHSAFLRTIVTTIKDYGVKVLAYSAWSLIDSFEFTAGFGRPFGLVHVDYESGSLNRSLKESSSFWIEMADTGKVPFVPSSVTTQAPPTAEPTAKPTSLPPTAQPTGKPTSLPPTAEPTGKPTSLPPTAQPTAKPTSLPPTTIVPSAASTYGASVLLALVAVCARWL